MWIEGRTAEPDWISETKVPSLTRLDPNGAIGKFLICLINRQSPKDPLDGRELAIGEVDAQLHHIFPKKFVSKLSGWSAKEDKVDSILNLMVLRSATNLRFLNDDPALQFRDCVNQQHEALVRRAYDAQFINENCVAILRKENKSSQDYRDFLKLGEGLFSSHVREMFGISFGGNEALETDDDDIPS